MEKTRPFKKEIIKRNFSVIYQNPQMCYYYVYSHRNIFSDYTRRYILETNQNYTIIKEIDCFKDKKNYWYWVFFRDKLIIYEFNKKPSRREYLRMIEDIKKEVENEK